MNVDTVLVALADVSILVALLAPRLRPRLVVVVAALFWSALARLAWHLLADHFHVRYVWLYSGAELPWHLKIANVWGGDEGTLLFLAALLAAVAIGFRHQRGWALPGVLLLALAFGAATLVWNPFLPTPAAELAELAYRGMNAHLMVVWAVLHPPLLFVAYVLLMAPAGAAMGTLAGAGDEWKPIADRYFRLGWLMLTAGIGAGMWWAFEDYTFGQVWHWDPVQTSVFAVWTLATAVLHGLRRYRVDAAFARLLPFLSLLTVVSILISMAVTRNGLLQSSHRYIGDTSQPLFVLLTVLVSTAALTGLAVSFRRHFRASKANALRRWIYLAIGLFCLAALAALAMLVYALAAAWMQWPRADGAKPFFDMLLRWSHGGESAALRQVFSSWDVDGFGLNRLLAPLGLLVALVGGHVFLSLTRRRVAWPVSMIVLVSALTTPWWWQPLDQWFAGAGMTSQRTVAMFYWLDALLVAALYFVFAAVIWMLMQFRGGFSAQRLRFVLPVAAVHVGAMFVVMAIILATVLDSYFQAELAYPGAFGEPHAIPGGFTVTLKVETADRVADGGRRDTESDGFQSVARVMLKVDDGSSEPAQAQGQTLYRDSRSLPKGLGAVRELCRILDYRYARYQNDGRGRLDPFIYRGLWRDIQVWVPPTGFEEVQGEIKPLKSGVLVVVRIFPFMAWLWMGLAAVIFSAFVLTLDGWSRSRRTRQEAAGSAV